MSRVVYVGHVPFDLTEEQIEDIFKSAGPVQQTRLVFDRATGKSKGFAFVQYFEPESAASAVRNLDNYKVGNMHLKVNYSSGKFPGNNSGSGSSGKKSGSGSDDDTGVVPEIVNIVSGIPPPQKLELLGELRALIESDRGKLQLLLDQNPQLAYAIVQSMFELGKIDGPAASSLIIDENSPPPSRQTSTAPPPSRMSAPPPPTQGMPSQGMPLQGMPPQDMPPMAPEQMQMYQQIMALTPDQLNALPPEQRQMATGIRMQMQHMMN